MSGVRRGRGMASDSQENRGWQLNIVVAVFLALSWISVATRCYVRLVLTKAFQIDDWFMLVALGIWTITAAFIFAGVHYGLGGHNEAVAAVSKENEVQALKYQALAIILYIANMAFIKLSIAFLLLRIAVQRRYIWILRITILVVSIWSTAIFLFNIFQCAPVEYQWDTRIAGGKCVSPNSIVSAAYAFSVLAIVSDWLLALLPIPMLWNVKLNPQTKIIVAGILSLGIFASIATLIRIKYLIDISDAVDVLFSSTDALIWTVIETGLGITAASIVTLRPLLRALKITGFGSTGETSAMPGSSAPKGNGYMRSVEMPELKSRAAPKGPLEGRTLDGEMNIERDRIRTREGEISDNGSTDDILIMGTNGKIWDGRAHEAV